MARVTTARMISPTGRAVDIAIDNGFVGMVDRGPFDEFLRSRAAGAGAERVTDTALRLDRSGGKVRVIYRADADGAEQALTARLVIAADGARSRLAAAEVGSAAGLPYVMACHEIVEVGAVGSGYDLTRRGVL